MAITIQTAPATINAAWHPIIFEVTSDRYSSDAVAVTSVSSGTGAKARYAVASHTFKVGDIITGSAFTSLSVAYNVRQTVTVVSALYFETDLDFVTSATGSGTATRTNDNFQIKCDTHIFDGSKKTLSNNGNNGGFAQITTSAAHGLAVGDVIFVDSNVYSKACIVTSVSSSTVVITDMAYSAGAISGTLRKGTLFGTKTQSAISVSGVTMFRTNPSNHIQVATSIDLVDSSPTNIQTPNENTIKSFSVKFSEQFDDADGLTKTGDTKFSSIAYGLRAVLQRSKGIVIATNYDINTPGNKFLTNMPNNSKIRPGEELQLSFIYSGTSQLRAEIIKYNLAGVAQAAVYTSLTTISDKRGIVPINSNHFDNTVSKFDIMIVDGVPNGVSESRTFIVDRNSYQNPIRVYFENTLGGFDGYTFTGRYAKNNTTKRTSFKKSLPLAYSIKDRGEQNIQIQGSTIHEVYSQYLTHADAEWLRELINSPNVFIKQIGDTSFTPIIVISNESGIYDSDGLTQIKLSFMYATDTLTLGN